MNPTVRLCRSTILSLAIFVSAIATTAQEIALALFDSPPVFGGTYFSLQAALDGRREPPLPFNPFPDCPVYRSTSDDNLLFYDDRAVDYAALKGQQFLSQTTAEGPPMPGGGGGADFQCEYGVVYGLTFWPPIIDGTNVTLVLTNSAGDGQSLTVYDVYATTNLSRWVPGLNATNWVWLGRTTNAQTLFFTVKLSDEQCWYCFGLTNDFDFDGLPDAYERIVSHTLTNSIDNLTADGTGTPDGWYLLHGLDPNAAGTGGSDLTTMVSPITRNTSGAPTRAGARGSRFG